MTTQPITAAMRHVGQFSAPGGWPDHHSAYKSDNFDHEIMEIGLFCSNVIGKKPPLQQSWAEPW
jgi:hypothetical protein